ncbi:MAG: hypothetical protein FJ271_09380 [Planctomycetes bacterium]|nr:hypothetical protein [Planctomycetota bacterium]
MGSDMVAALGAATANGMAFFAANCHGPALQCPALRRIAGKSFALGETLSTQFIQLPQVRQTFSILGSQPPGTWGLSHGLNEHHLAAGCANWDSRIPCSQPGLTGTDLVRLVLERCKSARQGFEQLTGFITRHGQGRFAQDAGGRDDHVFLIADPHEAFLVEAAGNSWASIECHDVRAVSDAAMIRQDWQRIAPGLADHLIHQGWWRDDGSKLDFCGSLLKEGADAHAAQRRWGRATLLLEQQNGTIDQAYLRRLLADHYDGTVTEVDPLKPAGNLPLCQHASRKLDRATGMSLIAGLSADPEHVPLAWCAFGPPCASVYVPMFLDADLPAAVTRASAQPDLESLWWQTHFLLNAAGADAQNWSRIRSNLAGLQARIDQETEDFLTENAALRSSDRPGFERQAMLFMQNHAEQLELEYQRLQSRGQRVAVPSNIDGPWV